MLLTGILEQFHFEIAPGWFFPEFSELGVHVVGFGTAYFASFVRQGLFACRQTGMIATVKRSFL